MKLFLTIMLTLGFVSSALAQVELHPIDADRLLKKAHQTVGRYSSGLADIGGTRLQEHEKVDMVSSVMKEFQSAEIMVPNDIDPKYNTGEWLKLASYLYTLSSEYSKHGLSVLTTIIPDDTRSIFIDRIDQEFVFVKVLVERELKGEHNFNGTHGKSHQLDVYVQFAFSNGAVIEKAQISGVEPHQNNTHTFQRVPIQGEVTTLIVQSAALKPAVSTPQTNVPSPTSVDMTRPQPPIPTKSGCTTPDSDPHLIQGESVWEDFYHADEQFKDLVLRRRMTAVVDLVFTVTSKGTLGNDINASAYTRNAEIKGEVEEMAKRLLREFSMSTNAWMPAQKTCRQLDALTELKLLLNSKKSAATTPSKKPNASSACNDPESRPYFISPTESEQKWKQFYLQDDVYLKAVEQQNVGLVSITFKVNVDGKIDIETISPEIIDGPFDEGPRKQLRDIAKTIIARTKDEGWKPGRKDCKTVATLVTVQIRFEPCNRDFQKPRFEGEDSFRKSWGEYVSKNESYVKAVLDGARGFMNTRFLVKKDGTIPVSSLDFNFGRSINKYGISRTIGEELLAKSSKESKWSSATSACRKIEHDVSVQFRFSNSRLDPSTVLKVGQLSKQEKKKWENKAEWKKHKGEKKGGVHFSFGGSAALLFPKTFLGYEVSFGGLFGNVGGMEVKYEHRWDDKSHPMVGISPGMIINASPKRWPVRFYFPLHVNFTLHPDYDLRIGPSIGLLCMDIKMHKHVSFYMELIDVTAQVFDIRKSWDFYNFQYTPSVGFRFSRW